MIIPRVHSGVELGLNCKQSRGLGRDVRSMTRAQPPLGLV